jgi:hypothetical protein
MVYPMDLYGPESQAPGCGPQDFFYMNLLAASQKQKKVVASTPPTSPRPSYDYSYRGVSTIQQVKNLFDEFELMERGEADGYASDGSDSRELTL